MARHSQIVRFDDFVFLNIWDERTILHVPMLDLQERTV